MQMTSVTKGIKLCLTDRQQLDIGGVKEIVSFDENGAVVLTENGELNVEGVGIRIADLNAEGGQARITGRIDALIYSEEASDKKKGFRSRLFG